MTYEDDRPVYTMQVAAGLLGAHPQTLRNYERAGLVRPGRSGGNQRLYSAADLQRLQGLQALVRQFGLTMESLAVVVQLRDGLAALAEELAGPPDAAHWEAARAQVEALRALLALAASEDDEAET